MRIKKTDTLLRTIYQQGGLMSAQRNRRSYTKGFKADAVGLAIEQGCSSAEVGRRLGVSENIMSTVGLDCTGLETKTFSPMA